MPASLGGGSTAMPDTIFMTTPCESAGSTLPLTWAYQMSWHTRRKEPWSRKASPFVPASQTCPSVACGRPDLVMKKATASPPDTRPSPSVSAARNQRVYRSSSAIWIVICDMTAAVLAERLRTRGQGLKARSRGHGARSPLGRPSYPVALSTQIRQHVSRCRCLPGGHASMLEQSKGRVWRHATLLVARSVSTWHGWQQDVSSNAATSHSTVCCCTFCRFEL